MSHSTQASQFAARFFVNSKQPQKSEADMLYFLKNVSDLYLFLSSFFNFCVLLREDFGQFLPAARPPPSVKTTAAPRTPFCYF
jgi:hypothetical protein